MRMTKKILAIALSVLMTVSMMPFTVLAADDLPPAKMTAISVLDLPGDTSALGGKLDVAYKFEATQSQEDFDASPYQNYVADFVISFDNDVPANTVYLAGAYKGYENGKWVEFTSDQPISAGTEIHLLQTVLAGMGYDSNFTYSDVYNLVSTFYCGARGLDNAGTTMNVALNLYESEQDDQGVYRIKEGTAPITLKEEDHTFGVPTAVVSDVTVDGYEKAYSYKTNDNEESVASSPYKDYRADFVVSFDQAIEAGQIVLAGSYQGYNNGEWVTINVPALAANEPYNLLGEALTAAGYDAANFTYKDVVKLVKEFKCAAKGFDATGVTMSVDLNLYDPATSTPVTIAEKEHTFTVDYTLPEAIIEDLEVEGYEKGYTFKTNDTLESIADSAYKGYRTDFVISFDQAVEAGQITLAGSYQGYNNGEWVTISVPALAANEPYNLLGEALTAAGYDAANFTYKDVVNLVKEFKCAAKGMDAAGVKMTVDLNLYESATSEPITIAEKEHTFNDVDDTLPQAIIEDYVVEGYEKGYIFKTEDTLESIANNKYKTYITDFVISFDQPVEAGQIVLAGSYQGYNNGEWVEISVPALAAGEEYHLLGEALTAAGYDAANFTYKDVVNLVKEFKCAAKGMQAAGVKMTVDLNLYETAAAAPITVAEETYTFANDEFSITVADEIDLNFYVEKTDDIAKIEVTDFDLENESAEHSKKTYDASALAGLLDGDQYKIRVPLAPAQIRDRITVQIIKADGNPGRTIVKTVADYCDDILGSGMAQTVKDLAQSVLDYGKAASDYFGYNTSAFDGYTIANTEAVFGTYNASSASVTVTAAEYRATSVPEMRFYISGIDEATAAGMSVSSNIGTASFAKLPDGTIILQVVGIPASKLGEEIQISGDVTLNYTPLKWARAASTNSNAKLAALAKAIANYSAAANAYFG